MSKSNEWDKKEKAPRPMKKIFIKQHNLKHIVSNAMAFNIIAKNTTSNDYLIFLERLKNSCEKTLNLFDYPTNENDRDLFYKTVYEDLKKFGYDF